MRGTVRRRILLLGKTGQIGWELLRTLVPLGEVIAPGSERLDLTDFDQVRDVVRDVEPKLIVNAAAYTAVDRAEEEPELAVAVNGTAPGILAEEARRLSAAVVHYSTDYVFDGAKETPYTEEDEPEPINVYGTSKLAGERAVRDAGVPHLILRTSWVYGTRGKNFLQTILRLAREREELRVVEDQVGAPTWCRMIAEATAHILAQSRGDFAGFLGEYGGLYHLTAGGETSWHGFAQAIVRSDANRAEQVCKTLEPIPTSEYPTRARRPPYSVLRNEKLRLTFGVRLPDWSGQLCLALDADPLPRSS